MPVWGDGGRFGTPMIPKGAQEANLFTAFAALGDEEIGRMYWRMSGDTTAPKGDILDPYTDYEAVKKWLEAFRGVTVPRASHNMPGRGFAVMRSGAGDHERSLIAYYGSNTGHNHRETLNLYLFAYGLDLMPGLGYPNISNTLWRKRFWDNTISHNTVATDLPAGPRDVRLVHQTLFVESPLAMLTEIDATRVYPDLTAYSRMPVLVNVSDDAFYVVDFFRIAGAGDHIYSFHTSVGEVETEGAEFAPQEGGSYAGADVPFAARLENDDPRGRGGLQFFENVRRASMTGPVSAEWCLDNFNDVSSFSDDVKLRFTLLGPLCDVALATSRPPQNIPGNPDAVPYLLARRRTAAGEAFVYSSVIEPYLADKRAIASIRSLAVENGGPLDAAVELVLRDGRRDVIVQQGGEPRSVTVEGGIEFQGALLIARFGADGGVSEVLAVRPSHVRIGDAFVREVVPAARGTVVAFDRGASSSCTVTVDGELSVPEGAIRPLWTDITPSPDANGNYRVHSLHTVDGRTVLNVGDTSFIAGYDSEAKDYVYAFQTGASLSIPFSYYWRP
jgi:hypothetical protein